MKRTDNSRHRQFIESIHIQTNNKEQQPSAAENNKKGERTIAIDDFDLESELMKKFDELFGKIDDDE